MGTERKLRKRIKVKKIDEGKDFKGKGEDMKKDRDIKTKKIRREARTRRKMDECGRKGCRKKKRIDVRKKTNEKM